MYQVILGGIYTSESIIEFLKRLGIADPEDAARQIRGRGKGRIGKIKILYLG